MSADVAANYGSIQEELERAKSNLKGLNENIRRIIGRDPPDTQLRGDRKRSFGGGGGGGVGGGGDNNNHHHQHNHRRPDRGDFNNQDRNRNRDLSPQPKRRHIVNPEAKSVFSRLSGPPMRGGGGGGGGGTGNNDNDEPMVKPKLNSRVIREMPTRQEIVAAQGTDAASKARNRRMFGSLLGTLQKFCQEESRLKQREDRKALIEKKLEDQQQQERENMKRERQDLFTNRKRQQMEIKMLEMKMQRMKELETWEESKKPLLNFVRTKTKPRIYFLPKVMDKKIEKKLADSKAEMEKIIAKKRSDVTEEMAVIESRFRMSDTAKRSTAATVDNNGDANNDRRHHLDEASHKDGGHHHKLTLTKHDRHSPHDDDDDDDDDEDSPYHNSDVDDQNNHQSDDDDRNSISAPDISIVKKEANTMDCSPLTEGKDSKSNIAATTLKDKVVHEENDEISATTADVITTITTTITTTNAIEVKPSIVELLSTSNRTTSPDADLFDDVITDKVTYE